MVYGGVWHDSFKLPAYGGRLFDPDRFPFLEGRQPDTHWRDVEATPLPVDNRTVLHLLEALQLLEVKVPGGGPAEARRLSFRALDIEQIGHVYEGLLDHTAIRATEPFLGLAGTKDKEPEIPLAELEKLRDKDEKDLFAFLKKETGRSASPLKKALVRELDGQEVNRFRTACQSEELWERIEPFAGLVRMDTFDYPVVIPEGSAFVTAGTDRRSTGTHYTPRSLTEPIVQYTLEPLVYVGPAEGKPKEEWKLKSARELLDLKICDMACGSGTFLVQACRYMSERLLEAWDEAETSHPGVPGITPQGEPSTGKPNETLIPKDEAERQVYAMRLVAQRCLYGVDKNPLAAEMAKLSLWLLTLAKDKPFEFLDHAIRCGDSLVGLRHIWQLESFDLQKPSGSHFLFLQPLFDRLDTITTIRKDISQNAAVNAHESQRQEQVFQEVSQLLEELILSADILIGTAFRQASGRHAVFTGAAAEVGELLEAKGHSALLQAAQRVSGAHRFFHWPLEFPEVFGDGDSVGFDAFIGNPPFANAIEGIIDESSKQWLSWYFPHLTGTADYSFYFGVQADLLVKEHGAIGLIFPRAILTARSARRFRKQLLASRPPAMVFAPDNAFLFSAANVFVAALVLYKSPRCVGSRDHTDIEFSEIHVNSDNWWEPLLAGNEVTVVAHKGPTVADTFEVFASMTTGMAYDILPFVTDDEGIQNGPRLVTTGLIDPNVCYWGKRNCRYLKHDFCHPAIALSSENLPRDIRRRLEKVGRPKLLVAGLSNRVEVFFDELGIYCGAVSTFTIIHPDDCVSDLSRLCDYLNSDSVTKRMMAQLGANAMGGGRVTMNKDFLKRVPLP